MKIRVLYCIETLKSGGVEQRRYTLAQLLNKDKYELKIICTQSIGPLADKIRGEGVEVIEIGLLTKIWNWERYKSVIKVIKEFKPHIIHGAVFEGVLLATIAGTIGKVPIKIVEETSDPQNRSHRASVLLSYLSKLNDRFIGVAPNVYNYLINTVKVKKSKAVLINNGVYPPQEIDKDEILSLKRELFIEDEDLIIGSVGRLRNFHKRFTDLIEALFILKDKHKNLKLLIVGGGPDEEMLKTFITDKGLNDRVILVGFQPDPHPYFELMDVFAIVSHMEAFGLVAVEAMFHRLPVVASKVGGLQDIVVGGETGILVEAHNPEQIANAINNLLLNKELRASMASKGYERAHEEYSAQRYVDNVESLYEELLQEKFKDDFFKSRR